MKKKLERKISMNISFSGSELSKVFVAAILPVTIPSLNKNN